MKKLATLFLELLLVFTLFAGVNVFLSDTQERIQQNDGRAVDGQWYYQVAEQIAAGEDIASKGPFVYRVGTPYLASQLSPDNLLQGFLYANLIANVLTTLFIYLFFRQFLKARTSILLMLLLFTHWASTIRFVWYNHVYTDPWTVTFISAGLLVLALMHKKVLNTGGYVLLALLSAIGVYFREIILLVPLSAALLHNPIQYFWPMKKAVMTFEWGNVRFLYWIPMLVVSVLSFLSLKLLVENTTGYSFLTAILRWFYDKSIAEYLLGWSIVYGAVFALLVWFWKDVWNFFKEHQYLLGAFSIIAVLAFVGGSDNERFAFWAAPIVYVLFGVIVEKYWSTLKIPYILACILAIQAYCHRLFWSIPQVRELSEKGAGLSTLLGPIGIENSLNLTSHHGHPEVQVAAMLQYIIAFAVLFGLLAFQKWRLEKRVVR